MAPCVLFETLSAYIGKSKAYLSASMAKSKQCVSVLQMKNKNDVLTLTRATLKLYVVIISADFSMQILVGQKKKV